MSKSVLDDFPRPACADMLGFELLEYEAAKGWAKFAFRGKDEFRNPAGYIQGGMLTAMLDDSMGPTVLLATEGRLYTATIDMNVSFVAPAKPGRLFTEGQLVHLGKTVAFMEARMTDEGGRLLARATSSARVVPVERLHG